MSSPEEVIDAVGEEQSAEIEKDHPVPALSLEEPLSLVEDKWPTGTMVPLNSKCLSLSKWQSIVASFDMSTKAALAETHLTLKGNLTELGHDLFSIQVVLSDSNNDLSCI